MECSTLIPNTFLDCSIDRSKMGPNSGHLNTFKAAISTEFKSYTLRPTRCCVGEKLATPYHTGATLPCYHSCGTEQHIFQHLTMDQNHKCPGVWVIRPFQKWLDNYRQNNKNKVSSSTHVKNKITDFYVALSNHDRHCQISNEIILSVFPEVWWHWSQFQGFVLKYADSWVNELTKTVTRRKNWSRWILAHFSGS